MSTSKSLFQQTPKSNKFAPPQNWYLFSFFENKFQLDFGIWEIFQILLFEGVPNLMYTYKG